MTIWEIILTIITTLLGGTNILQLIQAKQLKAKLATETESVAIANMQHVIETMRAEIDRLNTKVADLEAKNKEYEAIISKLKL